MPFDLGTDSRRNWPIAMPALRVEVLDANNQVLKKFGG
jgi:hypothetical protein